MNCETYSLTLNQAKSIEQFSRLRCGALFMEQGAGKTRAVLELAKYNKANYEHILYVCPFSVRGEIEREIKKWYQSASCSIVGYESISMSDSIFFDLLELVKAKKVFLVCDESIFIKNDTAIRTSRVRAIRKHCDYCFILNGTPTTRDLFDLKRQIDLLSPRIINMSDSEFLERFFTRVDYKRKFEKANHFYKIYHENIAYLTALINPYVYRCSFDFVKEEKEEIHQVTASSLSREKYEEAKINMLRNVQLFDDVSIIGYLISLNMISATDENRIKEISKNATGRCVVFCNYIDEASAIAKLSPSCYLATGETKDREQQIERFKRDDKPLIITYGVGSYSLNLQDSNVIHFASGTFDYGKSVQAKARIKRQGQARDIEYHYYYSDLKIDSFIKNNVSKKKWLEDLIVKNMKVADLV